MARQTARRLPENVCIGYAGMTGSSSLSWSPRRRGRGVAHGLLQLPAAVPISPFQNGVIGGLEELRRFTRREQPHGYYTTESASRTHAPASDAREREKAFRPYGYKSARSLCAKHLTVQEGAYNQQHTRNNSASASPRHYTAPHFLKGTTLKPHYDRCAISAYYAAVSSIWQKFQGTKKNGGRRKMPTLNH